MKRDEQLSSILKMAMKGAGKSQAEMAQALEITRPGFTQFINGNYSQVIRFLEVLEICGYEIHLKKDSMIINLSDGKEAAE